MGKDTICLTDLDELSNKPTKTEERSMICKNQQSSLFLRPNLSIPKKSYSPFPKRSHLKCKNKKVVPFAVLQCEYTTCKLMSSKQCTPYKALHNQSETGASKITTTQYMHIEHRIILSTTTNKTELLGT